MEGFLLLTALAVIAWYYLWGRRYFQIGRATTALTNIPGFSATFSVILSDGSAMALDTNRKKIAFIDRSGMVSIFGFRHIVAVDLCKNGISHTRTNRGNQIVGAVVGKALFGDKGFVVGGSTASTNTSERISALSLKVYLSIVEAPMTEISFYKGKPIEDSGRKFRKYASHAEEWYARLRAAMANP